MQIEDIINYATLSPPFPLYFSLREYSDQHGIYYTEATVQTTLISDSIGLILEQDTFSPLLSYKLSEVDKQFRRLNDKAKRSLTIIHEANKLFNDKYVRTKGGNNQKKGKGVKPKNC